MHVRQLCEDETTAQQELGVAVAQSLKNRLADIMAARSINDIIVGNPRRLLADSQHIMAIDLSDGYSLLMTPNHPRKRSDEPAIIDWSKISRIKILRVEANHESQD